MNTALIRVTRKRSADPRDALLVNYKRAKHTSPMVFTLYKAAVSERSEEFDGARVLDLPVVMETREDVVEANSGENPLGFVKDEAVGLVGEVERGQKRKAEEHVVSLNGRIMQPVATSDEVVFDYYRIHEKRAADWKPDMDPKDFQVKFANREELNLMDEAEDSDGPPADDDDDSNDEDNWRNDYPDEDSYEEDSDHDDPYGELVAENWHGDRGFPEDNLHRRLQNMAINDRYEAYFEGESTEDDDGDDY